MRCMRTVPLLALALGSTLLPASSPAELSQVQSVYLLPMGSGLDQYLANQLTARQVFQVVTDPQKADAIFTDQIGMGFEKRLEELYPPPKPEKTEKPATSKTGEMAREEPPVRYSSFGRGRGNIFLVDRKSRRVIWSVYERPRSSTPDDLDIAGRRVVERLKKDLSGK